MLNYSFLRKLLLTALVCLFTIESYSQSKYVYDVRGNLRFFISDTLIARPLTDTTCNDLFVKNSYFMKKTPYGLYAFGYSITENLNTGISFLNEIYVHGGVVDFAGLKNLIEFFTYIKDLSIKQGDNSEYIIQTGNITVQYFNIENDKFSPRAFTFITSAEPVRSYNEYSIQRYQGFGQKELWKSNQYYIEGDKGVDVFLNCLIKLKEEIEKVPLISLN